MVALHHQRAGLRVVAVERPARAAGDLQAVVDELAVQLRRDLVADDGDVVAAPFPGGLAGVDERRRLAVDAAAVAGAGLLLPEGVGKRSLSLGLGVRECVN